MSGMQVTIKLKSNIILKEIYQRYNGDKSYLSLLPIDLLSKEYRDVRGQIYLSETQKSELDKQLYYAERVVDVQNILDESDYALLGISNSEIKEIHNAIENSETNTKEIGNDLEKNQLEHFSNIADMANISAPHPVIETVLNLYPYSKCFFNRLISDIVNELDNALNYSRSNDFGEMNYCIDKIRESYRKVMHIILDFLTGKNMRSYGDYFKPFNIIELEKVFKKKNINVQFKKDLIDFHNLTNAIGHKNEKGENRFTNKNIIDSFNALSYDKREKILLAVPNFLNSINLTNAEKKVLSKSL